MEVKECPICADGYLHTMETNIEITYTGVTGEVKTLFSICDGCGSEQAGAAELLKNKQAMIAFQSEVESCLCFTQRNS